MAEEVKRNYKDSMFRKLFNSEDKIRELYNALENTNYGPETPVEIKTLDDVIFKDIKDDLAFTIDNKFVVLIEHQSTINYNMPVRMLSYVARIYERMFSGKELYRKQLYKLPAPEFYVLYNGQERYPQEATLKLSDAFIDAGFGINAEIIVKVFNLAYNENTELLKRSETLRQYSMCISYVNDGLAKGLSNEDAVRFAIERCRKEGVLADFINLYGGNAMGLLYEYVTKEEMQQIAYEDGYEDGIEKGIATGMETGMEAGINKANFDNAVKMKASGIASDLITKITGLSQEEIEAL